MLLFVLPVCSAEEFEVKPSILDTYFLYTGLGEEQTSEYIFTSNRALYECEMVPNDNITCMIDEDYIVKVWYTTTNQPYEGTLKVTDNEGFITSAQVIVRVYDFGVSYDVPPVYIGSGTNSSTVNLFFNTSDEYIIGIRYWLIIWAFILLLVAVVVRIRY